MLLDDPPVLRTFRPVEDKLKMTLEILEGVDKQHGDTVAGVGPSVHRYGLVSRSGPLAV